MSSHHCDLTEKQLQAVVAKYESETLEADPDTNIELEIRFKDITREVFTSIVTALYATGADPVLECSVNVISKDVFEQGGRADDSQYIRKITFIGATPVSDTYHQKTRIGRSVMIDDYIKYSVGLAKEKDIRQFATSTNAVLRFKVRLSFDLGAGENRWRCDVTAIKAGQLANLGAVLKTIKKDLFTPALSAKNFLQELNFAAIDSYEVEIERIGRLAIEDFAVVKKVFSMMNPQYLTEMAYQEEIYHIATFIVHNAALSDFKRSTHRLKQLANQVLALNKSVYYADVFPPVGYFITPKADGQRAVISINGNRCRTLKSDSMDEIITHSSEELGSPVFTPGAVTIVDIEILGGEMFVLDVLVLTDTNISRSGFTERQALIDAASAEIGKFGIVVKPKPFDRIGDDVEMSVRSIWEVEYPFPVDGLLLIEPDRPYSQTRIYKWKPYKYNTIDFLAMKCPKSLLGIRPYDVRKGFDLYILFVGINQQEREKLGLGFIAHYNSFGFDTNPNYYPIQFSPSVNPLAYLYWHPSGTDLHERIVELSRTEDNGAWVFHHIREDRKMEKNFYGNNFRIAELTYVNYIDPFNVEDLWTASRGYFTKTAASIYLASNKLKRFIISMLLKNNVSGAKWVIDLAAGRGGDLHRYQEIGVENALFIDVDASAIAELVQRKFSVFSAKKKARSWFDGKKGGSSVVVTQFDRIHGVEYDKLIVKDVKNLTVHTLVADLKTNYRDLISSTLCYGISSGGVDGTICNFALHYMCDTLEHMRNLLLFNASMLKVGGVFIFTVMDGASIFALLKNIPTGKQWEVREDGVLKYAIQKNYVGDKISAAGQNISVLLPFSDVLYEEPLCNVEAVIKEARALGFEVELNAKMSSFLGEFKQAAPALFAKLTDGDREYIDLHKYVSLRKIKVFNKT